MFWPPIAFAAFIAAWAATGKATSAQTPDPIADLAHLNPLIGTYFSLPDARKTEALSILLPEPPSNDSPRTKDGIPKLTHMAQTCLAQNPSFERAYKQDPNATLGLLMSIVAQIRAAPGRPWPFRPLDTLSKECSGLPDNLNDFYEPKQ